MIDMGDHLTHHLALSLREKVLRVGMLEIRILVPVQYLRACFWWRGYPARLVAMQAVGEVDEGLEVLLGGHWPDGYRHQAELRHSPLSIRWRP